MSFLVAYRGYHQIAIYGPDQEKTSFITPKGLYYYSVMPFGLRNAGATYQRLATIMLKKLLGKTMEVYIDDMVVKSKERQDHIADLKEAFEILREYKLKLNASKFAVGISSGKFLGHLVTIRGIEANPDQIIALQRLQSPRTTKEVQRLTGMATTLNRFISWSSNKFSEHVVSVVLLRDKGSKQIPVHYVSKTLLDAETRYLPLEKLADFSGRISTWSVELSQYDIDYQSRIAIKGQVLADFVAEFSPIRDWDCAFPTQRSKDGIIPSTGFSASNNVAEYEALLVGLQSAKTLKVKRIRVYYDSQLVVNQLFGEYKTRNEKMAACVEAAKDLLDTFEKVYIEQISSGQNGHADSLAWLAATMPTEFKRRVAIDYLSKLSIGRSVELVHRAMTQGYWWPHMQEDAKVSQFQKKFKGLCAQYGIRNYYSTPAYP
ncbi:uncharacterized protein LOC131306877 [Rhododendron vialii]|uniref:uncharacterized protein LOC131306877 n=1 Tax=Rhododendron vialii TaxID=182163 RepID=UPI00265D9FDE|nr:uncharacterized protein LOC131306877 [Rhododendron vialii]